MNLAVFYTGDVRYNQDIANSNHQKLFDRLKEIIPITVYRFTKDDPDRGLCPYDPPPHVEDPDNVYRRGYGGAVQVWDFLRGVERTTEQFIMRIRTDLWFTPSSIECICYELKEMIEGRSDISYFGSDWINENAGVKNNRLSVHIDFDNVIQDFVVMARRDKLKPKDQCIDDINGLNPNKRRSGNKVFRFIIPTTHQEIDGSITRLQHAQVYRTLCQIWLIRRNYEGYPLDMEVCKHYIQSYIIDEKAKGGKKQLIDPHPMQDAVNWWRRQFGWPPRKVEVGRWTAWQSLTPTLGVMFIGLKRFTKTTKSNHKKVLEVLEKKYGANIYDFFRDDANPNCPFDQSGKIQVWDFFKGAAQVKEEILIKIRSDVYFTDSAIAALCKEIDNVIAEETDIVYMGIDFMNDYSAVHKREDARSVKGHKVTDFVVVARKDKLANGDDVIELMRHSVKDKSGNKTFNLIMSESAKATKVSCQMYLVRKEYEKYDNWQIYWDWCSQYHKSPDAQKWVWENVNTIRGF
jgi:hypothetical protein